MLGRIMMLRGCGQSATLLRQRPWLVSAVHTRTPILAAPASAIYRSRQRKQGRALREVASCRLSSMARDGQSAFGRASVAAAASQDANASTSGEVKVGEPQSAGAGDPEAAGADAGGASASAEALDEEEEEEEEESSDEEGAGGRSKGPERRILKISTGRGLKELLMVGNVIVEPSLAEMIEPADNQRITQSEYIQSSVSVAACPPPKYPEFAMIGRSNVGKSSLINSITSRKALAMVSKTPGKTQTINHFKVVSGSSGPWYLVDLPGYGFAKAPGDTTKQWAKFTQDYFLKRESLVSVMLLGASPSNRLSGAWQHSRFWLVLPAAAACVWRPVPRLPAQAVHLDLFVDGSIPPQSADLEVADWLGENGVPFSIVFTKIDKKRKVRPGKRSNAMENVTAFQEELGRSWAEFPPMVLTSASSGSGKQELGNHIAYLRNRWKKGGVRRAVPPPEKPAGAAAAAGTGGGGKPGAAGSAAAAKAKASMGGRGPKGPAPPPVDEDDF